MKMERKKCPYCGSLIPDEGDYVPAVWDYLEWARLAEYHSKDCEWILTRAHRWLVD